MLRFLVAVTVGVYLGFQWPRYARECREICRRCFEYFHDRSHQEGTK